MADPAASYLGPSSATNEWIETVEEDERFLPTFQGDASLIKEGLWLGSEENVRDLVWLKVEKITRIVTIMPYPVDPTDSGDVSETLKLWYADNVEALFLEALDTPTQLVPAAVLSFHRACHRSRRCFSDVRYLTTCGKRWTSSMATSRREDPSSCTAAAASRGPRRWSSRRSW
jgi:hypothetical protein|mmetsp:Transcript_24886/g.76772  ORF Transcript_24886/g.76772 Transcript_24886/m.76772 type:complete len:173 (+) Transcript_24886:210-728(+)